MILIDCMMNFWWLMINVRTRLSNSRRSRENREIRRGSSNSWILRIPRCSWNKPYWSSVVDIMTGEHWTLLDTSLPLDHCCYCIVNAAEYNVISFRVVDFVYHVQYRNQHFISRVFVFSGVVSNLELGERSELRKSLLLSSSRAYPPLFSPPLLPFLPVLSRLPSVRSRPLKSS